MKKILFLFMFLLIILVLFLGGCQTTNNENDAPKSPPKFPDENTGSENGNNEQIIEPPGFPE